MATAAALAKGSVHWVADENIGGVGTVHWVDDAGTSQGKEIVAGSFTCTLFVMSAQVAYARGSTLTQP